MSESLSYELQPVAPVRLTLPNCPGCDAPVEVEGVALNEETTCPHCGVRLLLVRIDGVVMFLRDGWT